MQRERGLSFIVGCTELRAVACERTRGAVAQRVRSDRDGSGLCDIPSP
jgi:hypothetical protein